MNSMVQWTKRDRNNRFVNPPSLPWLSEISGAVHLALLGLTAGRRNAGEFQYFKNSLYIESFDFLLCLTTVQHHYSSTNAFQGGFIK